MNSSQDQSKRDYEIPTDDNVEEPLQKDILFVLAFKDIRRNIICLNRIAWSCAVLVYFLPFFFFIPSFLKCFFLLFDVLRNYCHCSKQGDNHHKNLIFWLYGFLHWWLFFLKKNFTFGHGHVCSSSCCPVSDKYKRVFLRPLWCAAVKEPPRRCKNCVMWESLPPQVQFRSGNRKDVCAITPIISVIMATGCWTW